MEKEKKVNCFIELIFRVRGGLNRHEICVGKVLMVSVSKYNINNL